MHHVTQENVWLLVSVLVCVDGEFGIVLQMRWHQFEDTKQSHKSHQKWSFWLVSGQMILQMHHGTPKVTMI